ncbi:hypothetical protein Syun_020217 [Stephania yunnanensis]|uniref:Uncharacterized protein n=1 Tax=Stephania yunnanensis TaxID=152371 RepID=A0AAP0IDS4_9MAGN
MLEPQRLNKRDWRDPNTSGQLRLPELRRSLTGTPTPTSTSSSSAAAGPTIFSILGPFSGDAGHEVPTSDSDPFDPGKSSIGSKSDFLSIGLLPILYLLFDFVGLEGCSVSLIRCSSKASMALSMRSLFGDVSHLTQ